MPISAGRTAAIATRKHGSFGKGPQEQRDTGRSSPPYGSTASVAVMPSLLTSSIFPRPPATVLPEPLPVSTPAVQTVFRQIERRPSRNLSRNLSRSGTLELIRTSSSTQGVTDSAVAIEDTPQEKKEQQLNKCIAGVVVLNSLMMWLELDYGPPGDAPSHERAFWIASESVFTIIFMAELMIRVHWERSAWLKSWWNYMDSVVVLVAMVENWVLPIVAGSEIQGLELVTLTRFIRLIRLIRVVRLVRMFRSLYVMVMALKKAMAGIAYILIIMMSGLFVCAIFTTTTIGKSDQLSRLQMGASDGGSRFGTVPRSMYSLFELMTLEGWEEVGRPLVEAQPAMSLFLIGFIMVFTFGILNMIVAVVVEKTLTEARRMDETLQEEEEHKKHKQEMQRMECEIRLQSEKSAEAAGIELASTISRQEFLEAFKDGQSTFLKSFHEVGIPTDDAEALYDILDVDGDDKLTAEEILEGCSRIKLGADSGWDQFVVRSQMNYVFHHVRDLQAQVTKVHSQTISSRMTTSEKQEPDDNEEVIVEDVCIRINKDNLHPDIPGYVKESPEPQQTEQSISPTSSSESGFKHIERQAADITDHPTVHEQLQEVIQNQASLLQMLQAECAARSKESGELQLQLQEEASARRAAQAEVLSLLRSALMPWQSSLADQREARVILTG